MKKLLISALLLAAAGSAQAHDFVVTLDGQKVYFNITDQRACTAEVTYNGSIADHRPTDFEGELNIPAKVRHDNKVYTVTGIGAKAFSGAERLTGITMPAGIKSIGDFAFEGCSSLSKIIFPGNVVKFGQGVFFKCDKIRDVSLGSDWREIDLKMFRWSDSLTVVTVPAKIEQIRNMKSLKHLESIHVDINNDRFSAVDGLLYNKSGEVLYGCPRGRSGAIRVAEGTRRITAGALIDCRQLTLVDLPQTLEALPFREFCRMNGLQTVVFRGTAPIMTASCDGRQVLLLQVAAADVKIVVNKAAVKAFKAALAQQTGDYTEPGGTLPFHVERSQMPDVKNIVGMKSFKVYE